MFMHFLLFISTMIDFVSVFPFEVLNFVGLVSMVKSEKMEGFCSMA